MFSKDLSFLPTIVGSLIDKTEEIDIKPLNLEENTVEAVDIDLSDFDEENWWKSLFEQEDDGLDGLGNVVYLETDLSFEDILYFSTEQEIKDLVSRYNMGQLKQAFFELYDLYMNMCKSAKENASTLRKVK